MTQEPGDDETNDESPAAETPATPGAQRASTGPTFAAAEAPVKDLSAQILMTVARHKGETVRCRRISGNHYRCNWWASPRPGGDDSNTLGVTTQRVVRSQLLHVTQRGGELVMQAEPQQ